MTLDELAPRVTALELEPGPPFRCRIEAAGVVAEASGNTPEAAERSALADLEAQLAAPLSALERPCPT